MKEQANCTGDSALPASTGEAEVEAPGVVSGCVSSFSRMTPERRCRSTRRRQAVDGIGLAAEDDERDTMAHAKVAAGWSADVLIVDDTVHVRELYAEYLTALGGRVATAEDGEAAVAAARRSRPDVIVMDLAMPRMDGATAIKQLRADSRTRDVPIILLTGHPYDAIQYGGLEAGADVFLTKPCLPEELHEQIVQLLNRRLRPAA